MTNVNAATDVPNVMSVKSRTVNVFAIRKTSKRRKKRTG